ncbi:MAG: glycosyltransferase [Butyrivibrio sp.]|nr:glycosyltransferase [Butyrivibrio sp.]
MELVSIIVPVYNVKPYLERCVNSIMNQTYTYLEIILVDDGSTDGSKELCDELKCRDDRIIVIHQNNQGLSAARNTGIEVARGQYLCFVDSDDYVNPEYVKYLYNMCMENGADIGICGHYITEEDNYYNKIDFSKTIEVYSKKEIFDKFYSDMHGSIVIAWNKLYKRECIGNIRYDVGIIHEDEATTFKFLYNAEKIAFGSEVGYYYFSRNDSITSQAYSKKNLDILIAYENRLNFYKEHKERELYDRECQFYLSEILNQYGKAKSFIKGDDDILNMLKEKYRIAYKNSYRKNWPFSRRVMYIIFLVFPYLYCTIKKVANSANN